MFIEITLSVLFWLGFAFTLFNFISYHTFLNGVFAGVYVLLIGLKNFIPSQKLWGRIISNSPDISGLIIEISPKNFPENVVGRVMTTKSGKYFLKASQGDYLLRVKKVVGENLTTIFEKNVSAGRDGVVNDSIFV